jgi:hypothetical protein
MSSSRRYSREEKVEQMHQTEAFMKTLAGQEFLARLRDSYTANQKTLLGGKPDKFSTDQYFYYKGLTESTEQAILTLHQIIQDGKDALRDARN